MSIDFGRYARNHAVRDFFISQYLRQIYQASPLPLL